MSRSFLFFTDTACFAEKRRLQTRSCCRIKPFLHSPRSQTRPAGVFFNRPGLKLSSYSALSNNMLMFSPPLLFLFGMLLVSGSHAAGHQDTAFHHGGYPPPSGMSLVGTMSPSITRAGVSPCTPWSATEERFVEIISQELFPRMRHHRPRPRTLRELNTPPVTPWLLDKVGSLLQVMNEGSAHTHKELQWDRFFRRLEAGGSPTPHLVATGERTPSGRTGLLEEILSERRAEEGSNFVEEHPENIGATERDQWRRLTFQASEEEFERIFDLMAKSLDEHVLALRKNENVWAMLPPRPFPPMSLAFLDPEESSATALLGNRQRLPRQPLSAASSLLWFLENEVVPQLKRERELGLTARLWGHVWAWGRIHPEAVKGGVGFRRGGMDTEDVSPNIEPKYLTGVNWRTWSTKVAISNA